MLAARAIAFAMTDAAFSVEPPIRPQRPARRPRRGNPLVEVLRLIRADIATGLAEGDGLPRVTRNYPY